MTASYSLRLSRRCHLKFEATKMALVSRVIANTSRCCDANISLRRGTIHGETLSRTVRQGRWFGLLTERLPPHAAALDIIHAINRGEGIVDNRRLRNKLALQVRQVESATVRSYRVYPSERFELVPKEPAQASPYLEHSPTALLLRFSDGTDLRAELVINLDIFEMLDRLNQGYRPTVDELQGYYLSLVVFKNILGSAPYQEVLLTPTGHEFYSVTRHPDGQLAMGLSEESIALWHLRAETNTFACPRSACLTLSR